MLRVRLDDGRANGVVLGSGEEIAADVVVSNADPKRSLLGADPVRNARRWLEQSIRAFDTRGSMARVHLLIDELPAYIGFDSDVGPQHRGHQMLGASVENFEKAWEAERHNELPDEYVIEAVIQSTHDSTLAPPGKHTLTLGVQQLASELAERRVGRAQGGVRRPGPREPVRVCTEPPQPHPRARRDHAERSGAGATA